MTQKEYEMLTPALSASIGTSGDSFRGSSKHSYEGNSSPPISGGRDVKLRNESMVRNTAQGESKSKVYLVS